MAANRPPVGLQVWPRRTSGIVRLTCITAGPPRL
jgi:hypothetical protein